MIQTLPYLLPTPGNGGELRTKHFTMPIKVLIADDNRHFRETLHILIAGTTHIMIVGQASNGEETINLATSLQPDIILMDINMAPVNGFEATRKILKKFNTIKIIGLSLHSDMSYCRNMLRLGASGYITKTSPYQQIITAIDEVFAGKRYIDKNITGDL